MNRGTHRWLTLLAAALAALALAACEVEDPLDGGMEDDTFTMLYNSPSFQECAGCHAPGAVGFTPGETEATQDWSSRNSALSSLRGMASGMMGNFAGCNGVPFVGNSPETSLLMAAFDEQVRSDFELAAYPDCDADAISDMTLKIGGQLSATESALLEQWILEENGATVAP